MHDPNDPPGVALKADQYFALLADSITDCAICALDAQGHICSWNPGAEKMLGYSATEILGQHFSCFYAGDDKTKHDCSSTEENNCSSTEEHAGHASFKAEDSSERRESLNPGADVSAPQGKAALQAVLRRAVDQRTTETTVWCVRKDNSRFHARAVMSAADAEPGGARGFVLVLQNISESITVQQALYESEERFRILVQGVRDYAIYMLDPNGYITNWNSGAALIKGYEREEIVGQHFSCFYTPQDRARGEPQRSLDIALKNNTFQHEAWRVRKDGTRFWASLVLDPVFDENHTLLGYAKVTRDITEQKHAQDKISQQRDALHQAQKLEAIGRLTGSVAHDFNNFLAIIRTAAELLESSPTLTPAKRSRYMRMILDTTNRAGRLIEQLLSFARRQPLRLQVFCIKARIQEFRQIIETTVGSKLTLNITFSDNLAPVETDASQFETAVLNMVINARDATPRGGQITISAHNATLDWLCADGSVKQRTFTALSVADTGAGIEPSILPSIFEPFFTTKGIDKGTGLGLSQVYGFAKQSGGDVAVESEPGKGSCFTMYLPCASPDTQNWDGLLSPLAQRMFEQD